MGFLDKALLNKSRKLIGVNAGTLAVGLEVIPQIQRGQDDIIFLGEPSSHILIAQVSSSMQVGFDFLSFGGRSYCAVGYRERLNGIWGRYERLMSPFEAHGAYWEMGLGSFWRSVIMIKGFVESEDEPEDDDLDSPEEIIKFSFEMARIN